jgi:hypothetical protein
LDEEIMKKTIPILILVTLCAGCSTSLTTTMPYQDTIEALRESFGQTLSLESSEVEKDKEHVFTGTVPIQGEKFIVEEVTLTVTAQANGGSHVTVSSVRKKVLLNRRKAWRKRAKQHLVDLRRVLAQAEQRVASKEESSNK